ncbi:hypothetical protein [Lewinella cohaerens]|uniref:hypothetical protein n=1 Tax=Lewinella cohaerens TaxID=70995 RepID=UPI000360ED80|nr:hypothetical protein [Lewinella cohaerens]
MKHLALLSLCLLSQLVFAQKSTDLLFSTSSIQANTTWGADFPRIKGKVNFQLFSPTENAYHLFLDANKVPKAILKFSNQHTLLNNEQFEQKFNLSPLVFQGAISSRSNSFICFSQFSRKESTQTIMLAPFQDGTLGRLSTLFSYEIPTAQSENPISTDKYNNLGVVSPIYRSPDGTKLAYIQCISKRTVNTQARFVFAVMNEFGELLWQRKLELEKVAEYITVLDATISNDGKVILLTQLHASKAFAASVGTPHIAGYRCQVFSIDEATIQDIDIYLEEGEAPLESRLFLPGGTSDVVTVCGLYNNLALEGGNNGVFINTMNIDEQTFTSNTHPFSNVLNSNSNYSDWQDKLILRDFFLLDNGDFGFIAEVAYISTPQRVANAQQVSFATHQLIIPWFNKQGNLERIATLEKKLYTSNPLVSSFAVGAKGDQLHFLYNTEATTTLPIPANAKRNAIFTISRRLNAQAEWSVERIVAINTEKKKEVLARRSVFVDNQVFLIAADQKSFQVGIFNTD